MDAEPLLSLDPTSVPLVREALALIGDLPREKHPHLLSQVVTRASEDVLHELARKLERLIRTGPPGRWQDVCLNQLAATEKQSRHALEQLLEAPQGSSKHRAISAVKALVGIVGTPGGPPVKVLAPLVTSPFPYARLRLYQALEQIISHGGTLEARTFADVCTRLDSERQSTLLQALLRLIAAWVRQHKTLPMPALRELGKLAAPLAAEQHESGTLRQFIVTLKVIAQAEKEELRSVLERAATQVMSTVDVGAVRDGESESIDLLSAIGRANPGARQIFEVRSRSNPSRR